LQTKLIATVLVVMLQCGCAHFTSSDAGNLPDIERGAPVAPLDFAASFLASPVKVLLWNRRYGTHQISPETEAVLTDFIRRNNLNKVKVRLNQWSPFQEVGRIIQNKEVGLPYRIIAIPFSFITAFTGRLLAGLVFSDYYDPFSNTINIFSDDVAIALHEAGHAKDFAREKWKGTYALVRMWPAINLVQESTATREALYYLDQHGTDEERIRATRVLYPAFATYIGSYLQFVPFAWVGALAGGHIYGWMQSKEIRQKIEARRSSAKTRKGRAPIKESSL